MIFKKENSEETNLTLNQKIKSWINQKLASVIFTILLINLIYLTVSSTAKVINKLSGKDYQNDCDSFKYKCLNITSAISLALYSVFILSPKIKTLTDRIEIFKH